MAIIKPIGLPENDSERRAIRVLADHLPGDDYVLFHNLELPNRAGFPFEYDIILVGEHAVYAIEVKHYGGTITGNETEWELESGRVRQNPMPLANKKARILRDRLQRFSPALGTVFVCALIVLTMEPVRLKVRDEQADRMLPLSEAPEYILNPRRLPVRAERIAHLCDRICDAILRQFVPLHRRRMIADYEVVETLNGGDGYRTYLARHRFVRSSPPALLKVYTVNIYAEEKRQHRLRELITRDAEALYHLGSHPNIVRVLNFSPWEADKYVLALEWQNLRSLRSVLSDTGRLQESDALALMRGALAGLAHAHEHGVIHRNLRPESILIGREGEIKLANFDFARVDDDALATIATRVAGRLDARYAAPEIAFNPALATTRSDLYSLGRVLREAVSGEPTFSIGGDLGQIVDRMTAPDPDDRYASAEEAAEDVMILS